HREETLHQGEGHRILETPAQKTENRQNRGSDPGDRAGWCFENPESDSDSEEGREEVAEAPQRGLCSNGTCAASPKLADFRHGGYYQVDGDGRHTVMEIPQTRNPCSIITSRWP